jgi:hypothetical protein
VTTLKLDGIGKGAGDVLGPHVKGIYDRPGCRTVAIVELQHTERTQPAPDEEKDAVVKCRISAVEVPTGEQVDALREAMNALYVLRTAQGTLTEEQDYTASEGTMRRLGENLAYEEAARSVGALRAAHDYAVAVLAQPKSTAGSLRKDVEAIRDILRNVAHPRLGE